MIVYARHALEMIVVLDVLDLAFVKADVLYEYQKRVGEKMTDAKVVEKKYDRKNSPADRLELPGNQVALISKTASIRLADKKEYPNLHISIGWQSEGRRFNPNKFNSHLDLPLMTDLEIDKFAALLKAAMQKKL